MGGARNSLICGYVCDLGVSKHWFKSPSFPGLYALASKGCLLKEATDGCPTFGGGDVLPFSRFQIIYHAPSTSRAGIL